MIATMESSILVLVLAVHSLSAVAANNDIPEECRDLTYCTVKGPNYPQEKINNLFTNPKKIVAVKGLSKDDVKINERFNVYDGNCGSNLTVEDIYYVREDENASWRTVIHVPQHDYFQRARLVTCLDTEASCLHGITGSIADSVWETYCHQTYIHFQFLVLSDSGRGFESGVGKLPNCCSCRYRSKE